MPVMVQREKWILYKHTCDLNLIETFAKDVKYLCGSNVGDNEKRHLQSILHAQNKYTPRGLKASAPLDAMLHRVNTLKYWMFGHVEETDDSIHRQNNQRFIFSPLGNLYLKYLDERDHSPNDVDAIRTKLSKIFLTMLYGMQYPTPANGTSHEFNLYPFRLIFKLLFDPRLGGKLYHRDVEYILMFVKTITPESYEEFVNQILELRHKTTKEMACLFKEDEHTYVNTVYEWEYYTVSFLSSAQIFDEYEGDFVVKLFHPTKPNSKSKPTGRNATNGYVCLNPRLAEFCKVLLAKYSVFQKPVSLDDPERLSEDAVKEIYSFYPTELLDEIGENDVFKELAKVIEDIGVYAVHPDVESADQFERVLCDGMNYFKNVTAKRIGKAGHTDIECLYKNKGIQEKFDVEAKSTENKLSEINSGRLRTHRKEIGSKFTIVITPNYVPAVKQDISGEPIVILLSNTFSEYLMNVVLEDSNTDFSDLLALIKENLGTDISSKVSNLTMERFGTRRMSEIGA